MVIRFLQKLFSISNLKSQISNSSASGPLPLEYEDPFTEPVHLEIRDVIDLHTIPPRQVKAVVAEYLIEARSRGYPFVRIIHGKGAGVQREIVRKILARTSFVASYCDAPPEAGGLGATIAELDLDRSG
ncbi:MAG: Smr/MutS family protein [Blastocatellia bacterium]|nr:Smr/MutS family protein [Blastocatellia bacterium]